MGDPAECIINVISLTAFFICLIFYSPLLSVSCLVTAQMYLVRCIKLGWIGSIAAEIWTFLMLYYEHHYDFLSPCSEVYCVCYILQSFHKFVLSLLNKQMWWQFSASTSLAVTNSLPNIWFAALSKCQEVRQAVKSNTLNYRAIFWLIFLSFVRI